MYKVLVVDDDATSLTVARACLRRFNYYEVTCVTHPLEALSLLCDKSQEEKSYDLILSDIHMPIMDGFELMRYVNNNLNIPVVLISADDKTKVMCKGFGNGAPTVLLKPVTAMDVKHLWQFSVLWKKKERNAYRRFIEANVPRNICASSSSIMCIEEVSTEKKTKEHVWNANLHNRFVEAMLILGPTEAIPRNILRVMNIPSLLREQVASHLQKFREFMEKVLNGEARLIGSSKYWIDCNYYSRIVGGNPNVILFNQLWEERRTGKRAGPIPASLPLPPFNDTETSSSNSRNVDISMPNNNDFTFQNAENICAPNNHTLVPQRNYQPSCNDVNEGLIGRTNNSMFSSMIQIVPSSGTTHIPNQFISEQPFNMVSEGNNILFDENNFNNVTLQVENEQLNETNIGNSFGANQFEIPLGINNEQACTYSCAPQFGGHIQMSNGRWIIDMNNYRQRVEDSEDV
ncbi:hypothetical protein POM88_045540 [Heracleum sosnowskyi]|uniref:Response regulatory domain-containing protein n=1 Tax=Heracleum sosnowskyi TaxID=360622 RepID=A0AAD8M517_9APIA|nr:hypothetical protein POM88_045540 [Heracleum sosnowskyi]